jgi:ABC-type Fe3+-hydroxamate transport system substrate-binding protein
MFAPRRIGRRFWPIVAACAAIVACGAPKETHSTPVEALPSEPPGPRRIVALSRVASEFVLAIGAGTLLVGVDEGSTQNPELSDLPVVDLAGAAGLAPDVVLVAALPGDADPSAQALRAGGAELVEFAPHSLEDVFDLCRRVGARLVGTAGATRFEIALSRPLAQIGGSSFGQARPRVIALTGLEPLELAGGHSYETDLIEIAGGRSLTHGGVEPRLRIDREQLAEYAPDLVLVVTPVEPTPAQQRAARAVLPSGARLEFFPVDTGLFWLHDPVEKASALRARIEPLSRELEARR